MALPVNSDLTIRINSPGGAVFDGLAIFNYLINSQLNVTVIIDGAALSIASVIAMAANKVVMAKNAMMMIHNPWVFLGGDANELRKQADVLDKIRSSLVSAYTMRTGMSDSEVSIMMDSETWMNAEEALELKFIDEIGEQSAVKNEFDLSKFVNPPNIVNRNEVFNMQVKSEEVVAALATEAEVKAAVLQKEFSRRAEIKAVFAKHPGHEDLRETLLDDPSATVDTARAALLTEIGSKATPTATSAVVVEDSIDKFRDGAVNAMLMRAGVAKADHKNEFLSYSLVDMARACLKNSGVALPSNKMGIVKAAFTHSSSDFPILLENVLGKELQAAYGVFPETWRSWAAIGQVSDFKAVKRIRLGSFNSLDTIPEGDEYTYGSFGEEAESISAATKGKAISITRQMIINDDLGGITRIAQMLGRAAARTVGNDLYASLVSNPTMSDGVAMYHATHGNLGTSGAPSAASFSEARRLMRMQKDVDSNDYLNIMPSYVIAPVTLEDTIAQLLASETDLTKSNSRVPNTVRGMVELITDPRLDANSTTAYYFLASPSMAPVYEIVFLDGQQTPYMEQEEGFDVDGIKWKVRLDYGVAPTDYRGALKNAG
jgi:ATP-dependent Clp endopeptidase proteolytic subunit ClpP